MSITGSDHARRLMCHACCLCLTRTLQTAEEGKGLFDQMFHKGEQVADEAQRKAGETASEAQRRAEQLKQQGKGVANEAGNKANEVRESVCCHFFTCSHAYCLNSMPVLCIFRCNHVFIADLSTSTLRATA